MNNIADKQGVSVTSFIKNLVDKRLEEAQIQKKHDLILYDDVKSVEFLLKSLDRITKETEWP